MAQARHQVAQPRARSAQGHSLNEAACPAPEPIVARIMHADPKDAAEIARELPEENRARLAAFCYARKHMNHLGLLIASTCSMPALRRAFGTAAPVVFRQCQDVEATIAEGKRHSGHAKEITLANMANVVPLRKRA